MQKILFAIYILTILKLSASLIIDCSYINHTYSHLKNVSCCHVINNLNIVSQEKAVIAPMGKNDDVNNKTVAFRIYNITTQYFPRGLEKIFKNLKVIEISHGQLKEIHQTDLKPFAMLEVLYLLSNDIEILENGLFDSNENLKYILLWKNKLVHIDGNVFEKLNHLTDLYLNGNECIDKFTQNNSAAVQEIIKIAKNQCQNADFINLNKNLAVLEDSTKNLQPENFQTFYKNLTNLEDSRFFQYSTIKKRINALKDWNISMLWSNILKLNELIKNNNMTVMKSVRKLEDFQQFQHEKILEINRQIEVNNTAVRRQEEILEDRETLSKQIKYLEELHLNMSKISSVQSRQVAKATGTMFSWEPFWIGVCSILVLILMILLIKNYIVEDRIISYSISNSKQYDNEGNIVSVL